VRMLVARKKFIMFKLDVILRKESLRIKFIEEN
jgi:hypothetical protein